MKKANEQMKKGLLQKTWIYKGEVYITKTNAQEKIRASLQILTDLEGSDPESQI